MDRNGTNKWFEMKLNPEYDVFMPKIILRDELQEVCLYMYNILAGFSLGIAHLRPALFLRHWASFFFIRD